MAVRIGSLAVEEGAVYRRDNSTVKIEPLARGPRLAFAEKST